MIILPASMLARMLMLDSNLVDRKLLSVSREGNQNELDYDSCS